MVGFTTSSNPKKIGNLDEFGQILLTLHNFWGFWGCYCSWMWNDTKKTSSNFPSGNLSASRSCALRFVRSFRATSAMKVNLNCPTCGECYGGALGIKVLKLDSEWISGSHHFEPCWAVPRDTGWSRWPKKPYTCCTSWTFSTLARHAATVLLNSLSVELWLRSVSCVVKRHQDLIYPLII